MEGWVPDGDLDPPGVHPLPPQSGGHGVRQHGDAGLDLGPGGEVFRKGGAVADGFHRLRIQPGPDRGAVQAIGVFVKLVAHLAHKCLQGLPFAGGQLADGFHAVLGQQLLGRAAYVQ